MDAYLLMPVHVQQGTQEFANVGIICRLVLFNLCLDLQQIQSRLKDRPDLIPTRSVGPSFTRRDFFLYLVLDCIDRIIPMIPHIVQESVGRGRNK